MTDQQFNLYDKNTWTMEQRFYFQNVDRLIKTKANVTFANGLPEHAVYLILTFFTHARKSIRIFCEHLTQTTSSGVEIYANPLVIEAARTFFLRRGTKLDLVLRDNIDLKPSEAGATDHPLIRGLLDLSDGIGEVHNGLGAPKRRLRVMRANNDVVEFLRKHNFLYDMMVMDEQAWRIETYSGDDSVRAQVNLGDKKNAKWIYGLFDRLLLKDSQDLLAT